MNIYHQCGHNTVWNKNSFIDKHAGAGLIFSPVHEGIDRLRGFPSEVRSHSFLDPQFYLPNSQKQKLNTYPFFPEVLSGGFSTQDFGLRALEAARLCIDFQIEQDYDRIVIPTRYFDQMVSDYCPRQDAYSVVPFLTILRERNLNKPVYLTVAITSHMVADTSFRDQILNWTTSYPEIDGVYLIIAHDRSTKQISDHSVLFNNLEFITLLRNAGLEILVGYCNTESLLYSLAGDIDVTFGAYENTRMFSLDKFIESDTETRGPRARIYLPGLLNWVQLEQARDIREDASATWSAVHVPTSESERALDSQVPWSFTKPELYAHHFEVMSDQVAQLSGLSRLERFETLRQNLLEARGHYAAIASSRIDIEPHGSGDHITPWLDAISRYARRHLPASSN